MLFMPPKDYVVILDGIVYYEGRMYMTSGLVIAATGGVAWLQSSCTVSELMLT